MTTTRSAALAAILCLAGGHAFAAGCHMTVQGVPVIDDQACSAAGRGGDVTVTDEAGDTIRVRRSTMSARFAPRGPAEARRRRDVVSYGRIIASGGSGDKTCYYNQKATLCIDP